MKKLVVCLLALAMLLSATALADANFPNKPITMVVQASPGGLSDQVSQEIALLMGKELGVNITCVYKPGASGAIGMTYVQASAPDGYVIGHAPIEYAMIKTLGYSDIEPGSCTFLGQAYTTVPTLAVNAKDDRFNTLEEFVTYAKEHPGEITVGNSGVGSIWHMVALGFEKAADVKLTHVPYDGAADAATACMGGHIAAVMIAPSEIKSGVAAGELKLLGVMSDARTAIFPDVPTAKECGVDYTLMHWGGFIAPANLPDDVREILATALQNAVESEEFKTYLNERGMDAYWRGGEEADAFVQEQYDYFKVAIPEALK